MTTKREAELEQFLERLAKHKGELELTQGGLIRTKTRPKRCPIEVVYDLPQDRCYKAPLPRELAEIIITAADLDLTGEIDETSKDLIVEIRKRMFQVLRLKETS